MTLTLEKPMPTRWRFDQELDAIRAKLLSMSRAADLMLGDSVACLITQDTGLAQSVIERDEIIDDLDREIEAAALLLLATQQPVVGSDLRFLSAALKVIADLERIGDHAVNIAKVTQRMVAEGISYAPLVDFPRFIQIAHRMMSDSLNAFVGHDADLAHSVIERDDEADILYREAQRELRKAGQLSGEAGEVACPVRASYLLFVAHYLERVCDHCTNIAERVIFAETGEIVVPDRG
ncbi:MAG: phosphate signaling complex protein PhoU [Armatimonadota bacterium]